MKMIVKMRFGSHVYGTNVPTSDTDLKAVYIPSARDILLQRVRNTIVENTKLDSTAKNSSTDIDLEILSLQRYMKLIVEGQTLAIDMLFTPKSFFEPTDSNLEYWTYLTKNKDKLLHSKCVAFAGYCRMQANKYGIKGSRIAAVRAATEYLSSLDQDKRLQDFDMKAFVSSREHMQMVACNAPNGKEVMHLEVCNRKIPVHATVKYAHSIFKKIFDEYGHRAKLAESNNGVDWKALMHAVRVCEEGKELLTTGNITFPRPEAPLLLAIRKGSLPYAQVASCIEEGLLELEEAHLKSILPKEPDYKWIEDFIYDVYLTEIKRAR